MKRFVSALLFLATSSLLGAAPGSAEAPPSERTGIAVFPAAVRPGEPITVTFALPESPAESEAPPPRTVLLAPDGRRLATAQCFPIGTAQDGSTVYCAVLAVPTTAARGTAKIRLEGATAAYSHPLELLPRDFIEEDIDLNKDNTDLRTVDDPQKITESASLWRILVSLNPTAFYDLGLFKAPVDSPRRTSGFGDRRRYRYSDGSSDTTIHAGIDFGVPRGTPVRASAAGRVRLARKRIVTGNSVVIEHLPGIFTLYYHMDTLNVAEGQSVASGEVIGLSGSTGLSTGPHLHWEVRVAGEAADPDVFLSRAVLDKDAVLSTMVGHYDRDAEGR